LEGEMATYQAETFTSKDKTDKGERFKYLAERRVKKATNAIRLIGNLSNKSNYKYTDVEVRLIYRHLKDALSDMKTRFESPESKESDSFKLPR
jgi:hypothetical protein